MPAAADRRRVGAVDRVIRLARRKVTGGKKRVAVAESFVRQFYANVSVEDTEGRSSADLLGAALSVQEYGRTHRPDEIKVRVLNPTLKRDGWTCGHTVVQIVNQDMPFLVDSVTQELNARGHTVHLVVHPIFRVRRNPRGQLTALLDPDDLGDAARSESFMHVEIDQQADGAALKTVREQLVRVLTQVLHAVTDWQAMRTRAEQTVAELQAHPPTRVPPEEVMEAKAFLAWVNENHFTFLGYREYETVGKGGATRMEVAPKSGLGVLRDPALHVFEGVRELRKLPKEVRDYLHAPRLLIINKSNMKSSVHRAVLMDSIGVKRFDARGKVVGERLFVGLFTAAAYNRVPRDIPLLRHKVEVTIARSGFAPSSHDGKALQNILETFPRDELFQVSEDELYEISLGILHLQERQRVALFCRMDNFQRFVSCLVYVPRDSYSTDLRRRFHGILEAAFDGPVTAFETQLAKDSVLARVHFYIKTTPGQIPEYDVAEVEARLAEAARTWSDRLRDSLVSGLGERKGLDTFRCYCNAFPTAYREAYRAPTALADIARIEATRESGRLGMHLYAGDGDPPGSARFKVYNRLHPIALSDILPVLENMGLRVIAEVPYEVRPDGADLIQIHDFELLRSDGGTIDPDAVRENFQEAFARVWEGGMEDDGFNRLVIGGGLAWRDIVIIRACCKYLRQAAITFSQAYMEETLAENPDIARMIVALFRARFDPAGEKGRHGHVSRILARIERRLEDVASLDQDRIVRRFVNMIGAMLRTNFYRTEKDGSPRPWLSFKLDSQALDDLPLPRPFREIFVYSPRVEGVHLRFGQVARGGLRWSDRREDFRTEVLGLVKAQQVKNAVIVPVGSKGGFVVKRPPVAGGRENILEEGIACYRAFISGLLDLTDNLKGSRVVPPPQVVRHDTDDPYLVVAADKGTATFSDIANGVSADYDFWLGDAFASGGSAGYDHKKMGITARGAWESVRRHFRELGHDTQNEDFTVVGVGDMAGDVFGNGMLLSRHICLVGAFNHMHIFVDPAPDAAKSHAERERLFKQPRSAWTDYNARLISKGGGVFERSAKSIVPSPQMKKLFGLERDKITPNELISAMLRARIDLLWFGGIGTYVKAAGESQAEVGDRTNDTLRVNGRDLRARVIGEGANLAITQLGRIEFALGGGHANTDAVDNSAGVDCSDHEVNIKILLGSAEAAGRLSRKRRDALLERMTDEVSALVLRDNYLQTQCLSVTQMLGAQLNDRVMLFMRELERRGLLNREIEFLPDEETVVERKAAGLGMTRPELSVLLAYAKLAMYADLLESDLPDDDFMAGDLHLYFPTPLRKDFAKDLAGHRLRREIIATVLTNSIVNRTGLLFVNEIMERTGAPAGDVARAYVISRHIFGMRDIWERIEALDNRVPATLQATMHIECGRLLDRSVTWLLRYGGHPLDIRTTIDALGTDIGLLTENIESVLAPGHLALLEERTAGFVSEGAPKELARRVAMLWWLVPACDIVRIAHGSRTPVGQAARIYFAIGEHFGFDWLRRAAATMAIESHWDKQAVAAIVDDLYGHQHEITTRVLDASGGAEVAAPVIEAWAESCGPAFRRTHQLLEELRGVPLVDLSMLAVANRQLRALAAG